MQTIKNEAAKLRTINPKYKEMLEYNIKNGKEKKVKNMTNWANLEPSEYLKHAKELGYKNWPKGIFELEMLLNSQDEKIKITDSDYMNLCLFYGLVDKKWIDYLKKHISITGVKVDGIECLDGKTRTFAEISEILNLASPEMARFAIDRVIQKCRAVELKTKREAGLLGVEK